MLVRGFVLISQPASVLFVEFTLSEEKFHDCEMENKEDLFKFEQIQPVSQADVPQGSVLSATLFFIFINVLLEFPLKGQTSAFADDIALFYYSKNGIIEQRGYSPKIHGQKNIAVNVVERGREVEEESREIWEETMREEELSATDASSLDSQI
ncbi:hypothetical protein LSTR_LSTR009793 [Laodelphax striatellus]|uniref:Uncharacterized protein n=1 Tax=Laodelphax striatellus TaxID=195883 RepID=A0A482XN89_LAOST|nr:hypothetical protein LSTR_LSTR009793 [Laodelphax striatellus]